MKVVLFCGGYGMRMRDGQSDVPKPMTHRRSAPADLARDALLRPFRAHRLRAVPGLRGAPHQGLLPQLLRDSVQRLRAARWRGASCCGSDIQDWTITFVHTGLDSPIGERLRRVRRYVENEEMFLANYADVLTDLPLNEMIDAFKASDAVASLVAVPPQSAFHCVELDDDGTLSGDPGAAGDAAVGERRLLRPAPGDLRLPAGERRPDHRRLRAAGRPRGGCWRTGTAGSGTRPTRSRSAPRWRRPTGPATARGCSGRTTRAGTRW